MFYLCEGVRGCSGAGLDGRGIPGFIAGIMVAHTKYRITLAEEAEGGWSVWCDDLPGCASQGETRAEAIENIRIAIREYLEVAEENLRNENEGRAVLHEEVTI